ncbi:multidrug and toxin extrusion protein 1-like [Parambassis ranga]|uniref:Multidrug and toxin extrusion protein n=1 Tax=Parambassis ranga TaxID=210632 RepID=A0A6P7J6M2_9TELE|nr:multidrug and toxin extrusion protein 1-like [Parambassis ranga]
METPLLAPTDEDGDLEVEEASAAAAVQTPGEGVQTPACLRSVRRRFVPPEYRGELLQVVNLAGPVFISQLMVFMISTVSVMFCGHLGKTELAGVSLAAAVVNISGISIGTGLSSACDTLISQTYGSGNLKRVGVILQRGVLILLLACFPCWAVLINTEPLLLAVRQSPEVASLSQLYVKIFMPALPAAFMYQLQGKYLQNQGIMWPQVITAAIGNVLNAVINYVFLYALDMGVAGSAAANAISQYLLAVFLCVYICCRGLHKATWGGWSMDCLQEWGPFVKLAVPSMLMICLSWWVFEIGGFLAGLISEVELGAQSIAYQLCIIAYMSPLGFSVAASVRVGNALGAGNIEQAKLSCKVPIMCAFTVACCVGAALGISRHVIGRIFTSDQEIIQRVADVMAIFCFMHVGDAAAGAAAGVLRGAGKQLIGALCNLVGLYVIGFPIGASLMFAANMGIVGLWTGLTIFVSLQALAFIICLCKLDWKKAVEEALVRAGVHHTEDKHMVELEQTDSNTFGDQERDPDPGQAREFSTATVGEVLSGAQLVVRRGLTLVIMIVILVAGIIISNMLVRRLRS